MLNCTLGGAVSSSYVNEYKKMYHHIYCDCCVSYNLFSLSKSRIKIVDRHKT